MARELVVLFRGRAEGPQIPGLWQEPAIRKPESKEFNHEPHKPSRPKDAPNLIFAVKAQIREGEPKIRIVCG
jgi:hypothetical protein